MRSSIRRSRIIHTSGTVASQNLSQGSTEERLGAEVEEPGIP
jgi:hypothetical protein